MFFRAYQIYYHDSQVANLDAPYIPYKNIDCTVFFENSVIKDLIEHKNHLGSDYFAVVSYNLKNKLGYEMKEKWQSIPNIANHSTQEFTPQLFETELKKHLPDVMSFQRHIGHDTVSFANNFHPGFAQKFEYILKQIGFDWKPQSYKDVFYCNFFAAKSEIYEKYVTEMLIPAMNIMHKMPELFANSNYPKPLPQNLKDKWGFNHYTFHSFLCERMFTHFAYANNLNCMHY